MYVFIKWFVRIIVSLVVLDWFLIKWKGSVEKVPLGAIYLDIDSRTVTRCWFGCSYEDIENGDIVPMEIRLTYEPKDN